METKQIQELIDATNTLLMGTAFQNGPTVGRVNATIDLDHYDRVIQVLRKLPKPEVPMVLVTVEGGVVTSVRSSVPIACVVRDFDNIEAGDPDPLSEFCTNPNDKYDADLEKAGYPY